MRHDRIDGRDRIELELRLAGTRDQPQTERLRAVAGRCPVHRLLTQPPEIVER